MEKKHRKNFEASTHVDSPHCPLRLPICLASFGPSKAMKNALPVRMMMVNQAMRVEPPPAVNKVFPASDVGVPEMVLCTGIVQSSEGG